METDRAIVLVSGGMDSLVTAAIAIRDNNYTCFLHVNYGQLTETKELDCFHQICEYFEPEQSLTIDMEWLGEIGGSSLTDRNMTVSDYDGSGDIPQTYVPFRNANIISAAVAWAEVIHADKIYIGAVEEDGSGYPDCREVFFQNMQKSIQTGTKTAYPIQIFTPVIHLSKPDIVKLGMDLQVPFQLSWSCYKDSQAACGVCDSCHLRLQAFRTAGFVDPINYAPGINI